MWASIPWASRWAPLSLALAGWSVVLWAIPRWSAPGESKWHLVPLGLLATASVMRIRMGTGMPFLRRRTARHAITGNRTVTPMALTPIAVALLWIYVLSLVTAPPLLQGLCLAAALASLISQRLWGHPWAPGVWGALLLAVPSLPSVLFVFGYPWRRGTAVATTWLLRLSGLNVEADGAQLRWEGGTVAVDAPCSGLYMGWAVAVLLVTLWLFAEADLISSLKTAAAALALVLAVNVLRSSALFHLERLQQLPGPWADILEQHPWHHDAVGMALFLPLCLALAKSWSPSLPPTEAETAPTKAATLVRPQPQTSRHVLWILGLLVAAALPLWTRNDAETTDPNAFPGWPPTFEGRTLSPLPLTPREVRFTDGFPGRVGRFHDGEREIILRWLDRPTRMLHPAVECFRAHGYDIDHLPWHLDGSGRPWSSFEALLPPDDPLRVRERVLDADGRQWADVSAWYWAALLGRSQGPWWSTVVAETAAQSSASEGEGI